MIENRNNDTKVSRLEQSPESALQSNNPDILSASDVLPSNMRNQEASLQTNITSTDIISEKRVIEEQLQKPIARIKWPEPRHLNTSTSSDPYSLESWRLGKDVLKGIFKPDRFEASVLFNTGLTESEFNDYQKLRPLIHKSVAEIPMTLTNFDNLVVNSVMTFCSAT
jgi:DNA repair photolyase